MSNMKTEALLADTLRARDRALKYEIADGTAAILHEIIEPLVRRLVQLEHRIAILEAGKTPPDLNG